MDQLKLIRDHSSNTELTVLLFFMCMAVTVLLCFLLQDVMSVLDCVIDVVVEAAVREVADAGASYATAALV